MSAWLLRRVAASLAIVFAVVTLTFFLVHLAPGEPFLPGAETPIDPAVVSRLRAPVRARPPHPGAVRANTSPRSPAATWASRSPCTAPSPTRSPMPSPTRSRSPAPRWRSICCSASRSACSRRRAPADSPTPRSDTRRCSELGADVLARAAGPAGIRRVAPLVPRRGAWSIRCCTARSRGSGRVVDRLWHLALPALTLGVRRRRGHRALSARRDPRGRSRRTTCAPRAPRACASAGSCWSTRCATRCCRSSRCSDCRSRSC